MHRTAKQRQHYNLTKHEHLKYIFILKRRKKLTFSLNEEAKSIAWKRRKKQQHATCKIIYIRCSNKTIIHVASIVLNNSFFPSLSQLVCCCCFIFRFVLECVLMRLLQSLHFNFYHCYCSHLFIVVVASPFYFFIFHRLVSI